jgi:hypothetical protein
VHDARCRDQLVGRIGGEVEPSRLKAHGEIGRPDVQIRKRADNLPLLQVDLEPPKLHQLRRLSKDDAGHAPRIAGEDAALLRGHGARERIHEYVRVEVNHRRPN